MGAVQDLVEGVLEEGNFDADSSQALRWLRRRHRKMVARARSYRKTVEVGPTVVGQAAYVLPGDVVEIMEVLVDGRVYGKGFHRDISENALGWLWLSDDGGIAVPDETGVGLSSITLIPAPRELGKSVQVRAAFLPPDLILGDDSTLKIPGDFEDALIAGAIATALRVVENRPDLAVDHESVYDTGCEELRQQTAKRYRGAGPALIRTIGLNA